MAKAGDVPVNRGASTWGPVTPVLGEPEAWAGTQRGCRESAAVGDTPSFSLPPRGLRKEVGSVDGEQGPEDGNSRRAQVVGWPLRGSERCASLEAVPPTSM